ncbi:MAG TPA: IS1595 family transposase [Xanthobacteraceae bacterium]|nr:IS1595 family transposase [Xanthobacteraceae bacterium]
MAQHFLLSKNARTLSLGKVLRMSLEEAYASFKALRFAATGGEAVCPKCGGAKVYEFASRKIFKCAACSGQFSLTSGTIFASRKLAIRDILSAIAIFMNGHKGYSALQLSRDLGTAYKTAFVLSHKIREAMASQIPAEVSGDVEIDGAYFGGYVKPRNYKENRRDRRLIQNQTGKRKVVVVMRARKGDAVTRVFKSEGQSIDAIKKIVKSGSTIYADEATSWDNLQGDFATRRINHSEAYSHDGANTNQAESFFSRLRRAEIGIHHHIRRRYLAAYASEMAWRENNRRMSNGAQYLMTAYAASQHPISRQWKGYWQRRAK